MADLEHKIKEQIRYFKDNPGKIFGLIYPYIFIIGLLLGLVYITNLGEITTNQIPPTLPDTLAPKELTIKNPRTVEPVDVMKLSEPSDEMVQSGKPLYEANCLSCHGTNGKGDGPASVGLNPPPRNYTIKKGWVHGQKISDIYETLENGIMGTAMQSFDYLSPEDKFALAQYIRATFVPDPPKDTKEDLENLDQTYNLSKARKIPGQIPVNVAMELIIKENFRRVDSIKNTADKISRDNSEGAVIFQKITKDPILVLTSLSNESIWKDDKNKFIDLIVNNFNQDGFNDSVFFLNDNEWSTLYSYMQKAM